MTWPAARADSIGNGFSFRALAEDQQLAGQRTCDLGNPVHQLWQVLATLGRSGKAGVLAKVCPAHRRKKEAESQAADDAGGNDYTLAIRPGEERAIGRTQNRWLIANVQS